MGCPTCQQQTAHVHGFETPCIDCSTPVCETPQPCTEITDAQCTIYTGANIKCGSDVVIMQNDNIAIALSKVTAYFCSKQGLATTENILCGSEIIIPIGTSIQHALELTIAFICQIQLTPGPQGTTGAQGVQGVQGIQGVQGRVGANGAQGTVGQTGPTPWILPATVYDNGLAYGLGAAVTFQGGYYYRTGNPLNPGYPPTPGSINASWTPVADGGAQGIQGVQGPQGTIGVGTQGTQGIQGPSGGAGDGGLVGLFAQTEESIEVTNSNSPNYLVGNGVGVLTVPANGFQIGDSFKVSMHGLLSCANNQNLRISVMGNSIELATTPSMLLPTITGKNFTLDLDFTIRAIGAAGVAEIASAGKFTYNKNSSNSFEGFNFSSIDNTTFDTTILNLLMIKAEWQTSNGANRIQSQMFNLFKTF